MKRTAISCLGLIMMLSSIAKATPTQPIVVPFALNTTCTYYLTFITNETTGNQFLTTATNPSIAYYNGFVTMVASSGDPSLGYASLNSLLTAAGVTGSQQWYALGSTPTTNAVSNIPSAPWPVYNVDNSGPNEVAATPADWLCVNPLLSLNDYDQFGNRLPYTNDFIWTGTQNAVPLPGGKCGQATTYPLGSSGGQTTGSTPFYSSQWINIG